MHNFQSTKHHPKPFHHDVSEHSGSRYSKSVDRLVSHEMQGKPSATPYQHRIQKLRVHTG
ncbi:hypothetical protein CGCVW01_v010183 [Colletotrichum viniferum]|nr:hypothetical protein CGCVW01_v010183 [Colletotrichum viniferum]